jgi:hypothetical protein
MRFKKFLSFFLVILWAGLCLATKGEEVEVKQAAKKISEDVAGRNLIRKDLLFEKKEKLSPPRRNIFSPQAVSVAQAESPLDAAGVSQKTPFPSGEDSEGDSEGTKPDLRYLGYVKSGQKITALIFFEGEALAVVEDEMIREGIRIGKVTSEEIELIGADSQKWKYSLEGEEE